MPPPPEVLWEIDWPAVFAAQGNLDLRPAGSTITIDGVTLRNLAAADGDPGNPVTPVRFETTANGLEAEFSGAGDNSAFDAATPNAPALIARFSAVATALGFDPDPTRRYITQIYVSQFAVTNPANFVGAMTGWWQRPGDPFTNGVVLTVGFGSNGASVRRPIYLWTNDGAQTNRVQFGADLPVVSLVTGLGPIAAGYAAADPGTPFVWPDLSDHRKIGSDESDGGSPLVTVEHLTQDADSMWLAPAIFQMPTNNTASMTIEMFRLLRI